MRMRSSSGCRPSRRTCRSIPRWNYRGEIEQAEVETPRSLRLTTLPAGTSFPTDGTVDVVIVRSCFSHRLQAPIGCCCSCQVKKLVVEFTERAIRGLAAERGTTNLYKLGRHLVLLSRRRLGHAASVPLQAAQCGRLQFQRAEFCSHSVKAVLRSAWRPSRQRVLSLHRLFFR